MEPRPAPHDNLPLRAWLAAFRWLRRYNRYEVEGMEHLLAPGAALLAGYHGRPAAYDLCMLMTVIWDELGYMPHGIVHRYFRVQPALRWLVDGVGLVTGDGDEIREAVARGEHIIVPPGGTREGYRSFRDKYRVAWGDRTGYLKLAIRHGMKVIPVAALGIDDGFVGFNDGYALGKKVGMPHELPLWLGFGMTGVFPLSLPFPVKITQLVGAPIDPLEDGPVDLDDRPRLLSIHRRVTAAVQALLDRNRKGARS